VTWRQAEELENENATLKSMLEFQRKNPPGEEDPSKGR
jgi:hypothetical protein